MIALRNEHMKDPVQTASPLSLLIILLFCKLILRLLTQESVCSMTWWKELGQNFLLATLLWEHKHTSSLPMVLVIKQESFWDFPWRGYDHEGANGRKVINSKGLGVRWPWHRSQLCRVAVVTPCAMDLICFHLSSLPYKIVTETVTTSQCLYKG